MSTEAVPRAATGRAYLWNTAASLMSSLSVVLMLMVATRSVGLVVSGVFSLAIAVGQQLQTLGMYEVRTYHVTDVAPRFSFGTYAAVRVLTVAAMMAGIVGYAVVTGYGHGTVVTIGLVAALRVLDAVEDVFYAELQRRSYLDVAGRACFLRLASTTAVFSLLLVLTRDLAASAGVTLVVSCVILAAVYLPASRRLFSVRPVWERGPVVQVLVECLPLFLGSFLAMYLANAPRYAIERYLTSEDQGYFAIIYMPAVAINMLALLVFRPLLTPLATRWACGDVSGFLRMVRRGLLGVLAAFAVVALVTRVAGPWLLALVFGEDVSAWLAELMVLVVGGGAYSAMTILYYALTTMRQQRLAFAGYALAALTVTLLCGVLVPSYGLMGACLAYTLAMALLCLVFAVPVLGAQRTRPRPEEAGS